MWRNKRKMSIVETWNDGRAKCRLREGKVKVNNPGRGRERGEGEGGAEQANEPIGGSEKEKSR